MQPSVFLLSSAACAMKILFLPSYLPWVFYFFFFFPAAAVAPILSHFFLACFSFLSLAPTTKPDCPVYCKPLISAEQVPRSRLPWLFRTAAALAPGGGGRGRERERERKGGSWGWRWGGRRGTGAAPLPGGGLGAAPGCGTPLPRGVPPGGFPGPLLHQGGGGGGGRRC